MLRICSEGHLCRSEMRSIQMFAVYLLTVIILARVDNTSGRETLSFSLIVSYGRFGFNSSGSIPAIQLALEHVNNSGILGDYSLQYSTIQDSECNRGSSLDAFFDEFLLEPEPTKIALLGCGCSVATEPVAEIIHQWNISQISFSSAASIFSDRTRFRNYFRTYPNFENYVPAILSTLNHYGWNRIVFLTQSENLFNKLHSDFLTLLADLNSNTSDTCCFRNTNITVVNRPFDTNEDPISSIDVFEEGVDYRIFLLNCYSAVARRLICQAARRGLTYPRYAWIAFDEYPTAWWKAGDVPCSSDELEEFIANSKLLSLRQYPTADDLDATTISGITPREFLYEYEVRRAEQDFIPSAVVGPAYDAVWALALALNRTQEMITSNFNVTEIGCGGLDGDLVPLEQFNYSNALMGCVLRWNLQQTNFNGVSGSIRFDPTGTVFQDRIRLLQYRRNLDATGLERVRVGFVDRVLDYNLFYENGESEVTVFQDGIPPDGTPGMVIHTFQLGVVIVYYLFAAAGIIFCVIVATFNFGFRNRKVVRLTSPGLNYFIIAGSLLMYFSVFVQLLYTYNQTAVYVRCILHTWLYLIGYMLAFGTILAKLWRVYQIFHNPTPGKTVPRDWHLVIIILLVTSTAVLLALVKSASQLRPPILIRDNEDSEGRMELGVREEYFVWSCYETASAPFYCDIIIYLYLALLQIVGLILAFQTRRVQITIPILNDAKFVAALVYVSSIVLVALVIVTFTLQGYINITKGIFSGGILLLATAFLALMFIPKMIHLYRDPRGEKIFDKSNPAASSEYTNTKPPTNQLGSTDSTLNEPNTDRIILLEKKLCETEGILKDKERRINELEQELSEIKSGVSKNLETGF